MGKPGMRRPNRGDDTKDIGPGIGSDHHQVEDGLGPCVEPGKEEISSIRISMPLFFSKSACSPVGPQCVQPDDIDPYSCLR